MQFLCIEVTLLYSRCFHDGLLPAIIVFNNRFMFFHLSVHLATDLACHFLLSSQNLITPISGHLKKFLEWRKFNIVKLFSAIMAKRQQNPGEFFNSPHTLHFRWEIKKKKLKNLRFGKFFKPF